MPGLPFTVAFAAGLTGLWLSRSGYDGNPAWLVWTYQLAQVVYAWLAILSLLALAQRHLNRPSRALTYMTSAVFPWYILHQTLIVMAGFWLTRQGLGAGTEFTLLVIATIGGCAVLHEFVVRRSGFLRPWFGLKPKGAPRRVRMAEPDAA